MSSSRVARCSSLIRVFSLASHCPMLAVAACRFICCCAGAALPFEAWSLVTGHWCDQRSAATSSLPVTEACCSRRDCRPTATCAMAPSPLCLFDAVFLVQATAPWPPFAPGWLWLGRPRGGLRYLQPVCLNNPHHHKRRDLDGKLAAS